MFVESSPLQALIVGAGPAGATAALTLARAGARVRLLDRSSFPRNKPCGGGLSMRVLARFPYLEPQLSRIATHQVSRLHLEGPGGDATLVESRTPAALLVRRYEFDALLVSLAQDAGAELIGGADIVHAREDGDRVTLTTRDGRQFDASIVIAADGVHSVVARRLGIRGAWHESAVALDMMEETPRDALRDVNPSVLWVAYGYQPKATPNARAAAGYGYIFPKRHHVNIGVGYVLSHFRAHVDAAPYTLQRGFVAHLRARGIVEGESVRKNFTPYLIPVGGPARRPGRGRVLLAGDAGGFVNGFTAEGIYYAMVSGELAARAVIQTGGAPAQMVSAYRRACDYEIGDELRDSVAIQRFLFADRRRISDVIDGAHREAALTRLILTFACAGGSYRALRRRILARSPILAGRLIWDRIRQLALKNSIVEREAAF